MSTEPNPPPRIDRLDWRLLEALQRDGRATNIELAKVVPLSAPQCLRRVRALEERGVIRGYSAQVDPEKLGYGVLAFVAITIERDQGKRARAIEREIRAMREILECYTVSGDYDYLLKVAARDLKALSDFLTDRLMQLPGVASTRSTICMETVKPSGTLHEPDWNAPAA